MEMFTVNLKQDSPSVELAIANMEIEIEIAKKCGIGIIKFIHGYGSHGVGGAIMIAVRNRLRDLKKQKQIKDYFSGEEWDISNAKRFELISSVSNLYGDEDLNHTNPGITFVVI